MTRKGSHRHSKNRLARMLGILGPGLVTGVAGDDPAGIVTDIQAGAQFRYGLAWTAPIQFPILAAVQLMVARIGLVTGDDLTRVLQKRYPRWIVGSTCVLLCVANTFTAGADLAGVASGFELVTHLPSRWTAAVLSVGLTALLVFGSYRLIAKTLKWLTLAILGYVAAAFLARPDWTQILRETALPHITLNRDYFRMIVAVFGGTISPYMLVWQSAQEAEDLREAHKPPLRNRPWSGRKDLRRMRQDTTAGMGVSQMVEYFIFVSAGAVIFPTGMRHIDTAKQAAAALRPIGHGVGEWLFALAMIGTGLIAVPTLTGASAYAIASTFGWRAGMAQPPKKTVGFNAVLGAGTLIAGAIAVSSRQAMRLLIASQVVNGIVMSPLLVLLLLVANNRHILGEHCNGWVINALGALAIVIMGGGAITLLIL